MANTKVYVGKEGAQELYRIIKAKIPLVDTVLDEESVNAIANGPVAIAINEIIDIINHLSGFKVSTGTGADNHPDEQNPNTHTLYLVKIDTVIGEDKYKEWIYCVPEQGEPSWECIGTTSHPMNSWKQWSEEHGSSGTDESIYVGSNNYAGQWSIVFGNNNSDDRSAKYSHSTMIGYGNRSFSDMSNLVKRINRTINPATYNYHQYDSSYISSDDVYLNIVSRNCTSSEYDIIFEFERAHWEYVVDGEIVHQTTYTPDQYNTSVSSLSAKSYVDITAEDKDTFNQNNAALMQLLGEMQSIEDAYGTESEAYQQKLADISSVIDALGEIWCSYYESPITDIVDQYYTWLKDMLSKTTNSSQWGGMPLDQTLWGAFTTNWSSSMEAGAHSDPYMSTKDVTDYIVSNAAKVKIFNRLSDVRLHSQSSSFTVQDDVTIQCNSILMGSDNSATHFNSILIGSNNESGPVANEKSGYDDDGFCTAIGFGNKVGRNYDFAYGYLSTAEGGENIAFQHSTAIGYRNIAMADSTLKGTGNVGLVESNIDVQQTTSTPDSAMFTHNFLVGGKLSTGRGPLTYQYGMHNNVLVSGIAELYSKYGASSNFIYGGCGNQDNMKVTMSATDDGSISGNVVLGNTIDRIQISTEKGVNHNLLVNSNGIELTSAVYVAKNVFLNATIQGTVHHMQHNFLHNSTIAGDADTMFNNVLFGDSRINTYEAGAGTAGSVNKNILFDNSILIHSSEVASWTGNIQPSSENFLVSVIAKDVYNCFAMADCNTNDGIYLTNCLRVFSFGDNIIQRTIHSVAFGVNEITCARHAYVYGNGNKLYGIASMTPKDTGGCISLSTIFGHGNILNASQTVSVEGAFISGSNNTLFQTNDVKIFGNINTAGLGQDPSVTEVATLAAYETLVAGTTRTVIHTSSPMPIPYSVLTHVAGYKLSTGYYLYYGNVLYHTDTTPSGVTYTTITGQTLAERFMDGSLSAGFWYDCTRSYTLVNDQSVKVGSMTQTLPYNVYLAGNGHVDQTSRELRVGRIFVNGSSNKVNKGTELSAVFGSNNEIRSDGLTYSYNFIEGGYNVAENGSGIVIMGCGTTASGHGSIAIGNQLKSRQWQTVIGKYNSPVDGPERCVPGSSEPNKALFIVGNGYGESDSSEWSNESYIHRSNALELYADGRLKLAGRIEASNIPAAPLDNGHYALACDVVGGVASYRWVLVGIE